MPDSAHVLEFLSGFGQSLAGGIKEKQDRERQMKERQEDFLDQQLLKSIQHPATTVEDWNNVMQNIIGRRAKKAGIPQDQLQGLLAHITQQVGTVSEPAPVADRFKAAIENAPKALPPVTRPKTMGDIEAEQLFRKTKAQAEGAEPGKLAIERQKALTKAQFEDYRQQHRLELQDSRHADNLDTIQYRNDIKGMDAYNTRLKLNQQKVERGEMTPDEAKLEASNYARGLSDLVKKNKEAGVDLTKARIDKARKDIENIDADNKRVDAQLIVVQKKLADQQTRTALLQKGLDLKSLDQELIDLRAKRQQASNAQRQAMAIVSNPMLFDQQKKEEANWEWYRREQEVKDIDKRIAEIAGALPSGSKATTPPAGGSPAKSLSKGARSDLLPLPIRNKRTGAMINPGEKLPNGRVYVGTDPKTQQPVFQ